MRQKEFNQVINSCVDKDKYISTDKIDALSKELKNDVVHFLVKNRGPIIINFITDDIDKNWLNASGYLYTTKGNRYTFLHTSEHRIK